MNSVSKCRQWIKARFGNEPDKVRITGLLTCCVKDISQRNQMIGDDAPEHGDIIQCPTCYRNIEYRYGAWQLYNGEC